MKKFMIGVGILLVGALVGCSNSNNVPVNPGTPTPQQGTVENIGDKRVLTEEEATNIVNKEVPGGEIVKIEQDFDDAVPNYDFKILKDNMEYELEVNAYDGSIREIEKEVGASKSTPIDESKLIGEAKAKEIAQSQVPEGEIIGVEYEGDEVIPNYDISMRDTKYEYSFEIDALTGEILKSEKDLLKH